MQGSTHPASFLRAEGRWCTMIYDQAKLGAWLEEARAWCREGRVADYIPELGNASSDTLGLCVYPVQDPMIAVGDTESFFTLQSISKVFTLILALMDQGESKIFDRVGMEPTGDNFNSMIKLELVEPGKPFNPMINAGALTISSLIQGDTAEERFERILSFICRLAGDVSIGYDHKVYESEKATADRNRSLAYFLKHNKVVEGDVESHLDVYFKHCSIQVCVSHVARMGMILANRGKDPATGLELIPERYVQIAKVFMTTCGMYNASGEFAIKVGIPAKSGVSGGIMALVPGKYGIGVIGPALDKKGNSVAGVQLLEKMSREGSLSIF